MPSAHTTPSTSRSQTPNAAKSVAYSQDGSNLQVPSTIVSSAQEASSSKVTLEEYKRRRLVDRQQRLDFVTGTHDRDLREIFYMMNRQERLDSEGSPSIPTPDDVFQLEPEEEERFNKFRAEYVLTKDGTSKSISQLDLPSLDDARDAIIREAPRLRKLVLPVRPRPENPSSKSERGMPPPSSTSVKAEAEKVRRGTLQSSKSANLVPSLSGDIHSPSNSAASSTSLNIPLQSLGVPSSQLLQPPPQTITQALPIAPSSSLPSLTQVPPVSSQPTIVTVTAPSSPPPLVPPSASEQPTQSHSKPKDIVMHPPPSPSALPSLPSSTKRDAPLHPTLQALSPNPLSVTYASSMRPLPPDPFRRFTGLGIGGGTTSHRSHRKAPVLPSKNGAPSPTGPAGAGGVDLYRWFVRARASPGAGLVGKADKCLLTSDWKVAFTEQRFIRAMDRIEKLKAEGLWSFRQHKKQKGPVVRKAHWDHLLDEMRWMQTDFREERRWKIAQAFQLANAAKAYVRAKTPQARARLCVKTHSPKHLDEKMKEVEEKAQEIVDNASEEHPKDEENDTEMQPAEAMEPKAKIEEEMQSNNKKEGGEGERETALAQDNEDEEEEDAPGEDEMDAEGEDEDAEGDADDGEVEAATMAMSATDGITEVPVEVVHEDRPAAHMPALSSDVPEPEKDEGTTGVKTEATDKDVTLSEQQLPMSLVSTVRAPIFDIDVATTTVSPWTLLEHSDTDALAEMLGISSQDLGEKVNLDQFNISTLFPELPLYSAPGHPDESGKTERRWDDGSLNQAPRLTHVSRLMDTKPLLVSTLQPSKNRKHGQWVEDSEWMIAAQVANPTKGVSPEDIEASSVPGSVLFARKSHKSTRDQGHGTTSHGTPAAPSNPEARSSLFLWTSEEDDYLLLLIKQYGHHWQLISDLFNSTRLSVPTDVREPWDCYDRYQKIQQAAAEGKPPPVPAFMASGDTQTSTAAPNTLASKHEKLTRKIGLKYDGSRRKLRRVNITEAMRKCAKRRETVQRSMSNSKRVNLQSHETHNQIKIGITPTAQQLSSLKAERDEAYVRQQMLILHQQRLNQQQQQQQQAQAHAAAAAQAAQSQGQPTQATQQPAQQLAQQQQQHQQQLQAQQQRLLQQLQQQQRPPMQLGAQQQQGTSTPQVNSPRPSGQQQSQTASQAASQQSSPASQARPAAAPTSGAPAQPATSTPSSIPPQLQALQQTLQQSLSGQSLTPEQLQTIALQLYQRAQQQGSLGDASNAQQVRPPPMRTPQQGGKASRSASSSGKEPPAASSGNGNAVNGSEGNK